MEMITEWQIQSFSRKCAHSGQTFQPGDQVLCLLIESVSEGLVRMDVLETFADEVAVDGPIVGRWTRRIKEPDSSHSAEQKQQAQSVEELFLSMAESVEVSIRSNSTKCMIYILALFLERKRILKSIRSQGIPQHYLTFRHGKSKQEFLVEAVVMNPENMAHIEKNLSILGGSLTRSEAAEDAEASPVTATEPQSAS